MSIAMSEKTCFICKGLKVTTGSMAEFNGRPCCPTCLNRIFVAFARED
ncbi:hypothetical protein [Candidatus Nitrososphaera gargensis]|nr:hypothetical protein [Candidatus Nitrososphaera gargensis]